MEYSEFQKNKYDVVYCFLESIGNKSYWQIEDNVVSCPLNPKCGDDGIPLDRTIVCSLTEWDEIRSYLRRRASQPPFRRYEFPFVWSEEAGSNEPVIRHRSFFSVAEMLDDPKITGLYVREDELNIDVLDYCELYAEHGTGYACCRGPVKKMALTNFSPANIDWFIKISKKSTPDYMAEFMLDFLNDKVEVVFDYCLETVLWLKQLGYDVSEIMKAADARRLRMEQKRLEERDQKQAEELARKEEEARELASSRNVVRDLLIRDKECIFSTIPFGIDALVTLIEERVGKIPIRTKGWIYTRLYSVTGEYYAYKRGTSAKGKSKTFNNLLYALRVTLKAKANSTKTQVISGD
jgi:DNA-binding transcriptional MerR regulator